MGVQTNLVKRRVRNGRTRWVIDFYFLKTRGERCRFVRFATIQSREGAEREARELYERAVRTGSPDIERPLACPTLAAFYETDFTPIFMPRYRPNTQVRYRALWRQWVGKSLGHLILDAIDIAEILRFAAELNEAKVQPKGPVRFVQTLLHAAVTLGKLSAAPRLPKGFVREPRKVPTAPTLPEVEAILAFARGWVKVAIALGVYAGLRSGEIRGLEVGDLDFEGGLLHVRQTLSCDTAMEPKGMKERVVGIAPQLAAILQDAVHGKPPTGRVVVTAEGTTPKRQAVYNAVVSVQKRMGSPRTWSVHAMRHAFCSHLVRVGIGIGAVKDLAGHSSLAVTNRYVHALGADLAEAVRRGFGEVVTDR